MVALVDTSTLLALADRRDAAHARMTRTVLAIPDELIVPVSVLPEADYLITERVGPDVAAAVLEGIAKGEMRLEQVTNADLPRIVELMRQYADSDVDFVDASIVAVAERLGVRRILTLDHRHFGTIRPRHCPALEIAP
jgi:predicted nucleic acid-binding protein